MKSLLVLLALTSLAFSQKVSYKGYKVLKTEPLSAESTLILRDLQQEDMFDFWQEPIIGRTADIMASSKTLPYLTEILEKSGIKYSTMIEDVEDLHQSNQRYRKNLISKVA